MANDIQLAVAQRKAMIDRDHELPVSKQRAPLGISRGSVYNEPVAVSPSDLALMRSLDELHVEHPHGSRMLKDLLVAEARKIGRRHVRTLMQQMGIEAVYRRPRTSNPAPGHKLFPYLLRGLTIGRQSGLGLGHYLHPDGARLRLPGGRGGLVQPAGSGVAAVDHAGGGVLPYASC